MRLDCERVVRLVRAPEAKVVWHIRPVACLHQRRDELFTKFRRVRLPRFGHREILLLQGFDVHESAVERAASSPRRGRLSMRSKGPSHQLFLTRPTFEEIAPNRSTSVRQRYQGGGMSRGRKALIGAGIGAAGGAVVGISWAGGFKPVPLPPADRP